MFDFLKWLFSQGDIKADDLAEQEELIAELEEEEEEDG